MSSYFYTKPSYGLYDSRRLLSIIIQMSESTVPKYICYSKSTGNMNGEFLCPLTGLNDFDILGAAPII